MGEGDEEKEEEEEGLCKANAVRRRALLSWWGGYRV